MSGSSVEYTRMWRERNRERFRALQRKYAKRNWRKWKKPDPVKRSACMKSWRERNREKIRTYYRNRYRTNVQSALRTRIASRISKVLRRNRTYKTNNTLLLLGCSLDQFKQWIESKFLPGMTWENRNLWHLDHIKPCASFDLRKPKQQALCFHYANYQPLWWRDNLVKSSKMQPA